MRRWINPRHLLGASLIALTSCTFGNGHICGPQTPIAYCDKEAYEKLAHPKPYGTHWVKEGMTEANRLNDTEACGSARSEYVGFSKEKIESERRPEDPNDIAPYLRLRSAWSECMKSKGYAYSK